MDNFFRFLMVAWLVGITLTLGNINTTMREGLTDIGNSLAAISKAYRHSDNAY